LNDEHEIITIDDCMTVTSPDSTLKMALDQLTVKLFGIEDLTPSPFEEYAE
jgi:hypothetical protein